MLQLSVIIFMKKTLMILEEDKTEVFNPLVVFELVVYDKKAAALRKTVTLCARHSLRQWLKHEDF
jgi:hypothetical protein